MYCRILALEFDAVTELEIVVVADCYIEHHLYVEEHRSRAAGRLKIFTVPYPFLP